MIITNQITNAKCLQKDLWETPDELFKQLNDEFKFTLDPCCTFESKKCDRYYTPDVDGLSKSWARERVFVNPPYSRGNIDKWVRKCCIESDSAQIIVALIPVSTSSAWFHNWVLGVAELRFLKGRVKFKGASHTAPFSSMLAIYG